jgi:hypothetical protein
MSRSSLAFEIVTVLLIVVVAGGYIGLSSIGPAQPSATPTPAPSVQEQVRDSAVAYIATKYPQVEPLVANLSWSGGRVNTGLLGAEKYFYNSSGWAMQLSYPVVPNAIYTISANYSAGDVSVEWQGTCQNGNVTEVSCITYGIDVVLSPQEQVLYDAMAYIRVNHTETAPYQLISSWTGRRATPEGLVGYETYVYTGMGWNVTVGYVVYYDMIYHVNATYVPANSQNGQVVVDWQGTWHNGTVTETKYAYTP